MATTVNNAFAEFMKDIVNLDPDVVSEARSSRDDLLENIAEFDNDDGFFTCTKDSMFILVHLPAKQNVEILMTLI